MFNMPSPGLPTIGSTILLLAYLLLLHAYFKDFSKLKHKYNNVRELLEKTELQLSLVRTAHSHCRRIENKTAGLEQELKDTRAELGSAIKRHQEEVVKNGGLEKKLKESENIVRLMGQSNRRTRSIAQNLISEKLSLNERIATYGAQLRAAKEDYDVWIEFGTKLKARAEKAEKGNEELKQENSKLKEENERFRLERSHLAAQLASEKEDGLDLTMRIKWMGEEMCGMTKTLERYQKHVAEMGKSDEEAWKEVGACKVAEEKKRGVADVSDELEVQADCADYEDEILDLVPWYEEESGEPEQVVAWEDEKGREEALNEEEEEKSGDVEEWIEVGDEEWVEVENEEEGVW